MSEKKCPSCGHVSYEADRVSIHGMYDMHLFHEYHGKTVDELIENWLEHISKPIPATVDNRKIEDMGATDLCPAVVLSGKRELRRVGKMVFTRNRKPDPKDLKEYREALLADPDIPRLLAQQEVSNVD